MNVRLREAGAADAAALARLLTELGYPTDAVSVPDRMARFHAAGGAIALVAEHEGEVVGLVTAHAFSSIHADGEMGRLTTLVVSSEVRHQGIGRQLVSAAESWLQAQGCVRSSVVTGIGRAEAHEFYSKMGYKQTGLHFTRPWRSNG
jgi:GNAT superfamily N-acetyltransferase